jgi:hypothetical protein
MSSTSTSSNPKVPLSESNGANGTATLPQPGWPVPEFKHNLGDNPLWQALMDEIEANRQTDIAEANRLADLELEK